MVESFPGVIERPLLPDEFSIYLDNIEPLPLQALGRFLTQIDRAARAVKGMQDFEIVLSDFAMGSAEPRARILPRKKEDRARYLRELRQAENNDALLKWTKSAVAAALVGPVIGAIATSIVSGEANPAAYRIVNEYHVQNIFLRGPNEAPLVISGQEVVDARNHRLRRKREILEVDPEIDRLLRAMHSGQAVKVAGWLEHDRSGAFFSTMDGNRFQVVDPDFRPLQDGPMAIEAEVHRDRHGDLQLRILNLISSLDAL